MVIDFSQLTRSFSKSLFLQHKVEKGSELGSGGFGTVFRGSAYIYNTKKEIALKKSKVSNHKTFKTEIDMFEKLKNNPNQFIVQFFGIFTIDKDE